MNKQLTKFEQLVELSDLNYNLYELEKAEKVINIIESGTVSHELALKSFVKNTIEALNKIKVLLDNNVPKE